jgi:hypothetical protein
MNRLRLLTFAALCVLLSGLFVPSVYSQSATATLSGTVEDEQGAVIPGVTVAILNIDTSLRREATTSESGSFTFTLLPPGRYTITGQRQGFSPLRVENIVLNVGDQKALQIQLKAGDVNATVTVDSSAETIRTDGSVGTVVNRQFVANIPLNGRSLQALIQLAPGVTLTANNVGNLASAQTGSGQFSVNGQRTNANYFMVDGVSANTGVNTGLGVFPQGAGAGQSAGLTALGGTNSLVSLDALQEFRIETSSYAAEFGRTPGGQISLITRGGTNQFHGSASYYFRNEVLDANDWFANANRQPKPKERQNFFGGVLGGPIKRDQLFFFASYEGLRLQQPKAQVVIVPTVALRGQAVPALRPYLNALPLPNGQNFGDGTAQFAASYSDSANFNIFAVRLDGRMTKSLSGSFRINHAPSATATRTESLSTVSNLQTRNDSYTGSVTWATNSRLLADLRLNWTRNEGKVFADIDTFGGAAIPRASDIFAPGRDPSRQLFFFSTRLGRFDWGQGNSDAQRQLNTVGTVAWLVGEHQLKFGADYLRLLPIIGATGYNIEQLGLDTAQQAIAGQASLYVITAGDPLPRRPIISSLSLFAQDAWHVARQLTLTYGIRFERVPPPSETTGRLPRALLGIENNVLQNPRLATEGVSLFHSRFGSFAPRFGVAYQLSTRPSREMTLRGGAGIFYDTGLGNIANSFSGVYPFFAQKVVGGPPFPLSANVLAEPNPQAGPPLNVYALDPNLRLPYAAQWNVTWDQRLGKGQTISAAYLGANGRRLLLLQLYASQHLADFPNASTNLFIQRNLGRSNYNALQLQYQRPLRRGLQTLASYTLARSEDNASDQTSFAPPASQGSLLTQNWGPSNFDVRHVFSAALTYEFPKTAMPAPFRALLGGWGSDLLIRYQSAFPASPTLGATLSDGVIYFRMPNVISGVPLYVDDPTVPSGRIFNNRAYTLADNPQLASAGCLWVARPPGDTTTPIGAARGAFCTPPAGQQGNFARNGLRGFPASQVDLALRREFKLRELLRLQLRAELFNLFNHPNFGAPENSVSSALFGQPSSMLNRSLGGLNALYQMGGPRSAQVGLKLIGKCATNNESATRRLVCVLRNR